MSNRMLYVLTVLIWGSTWIAIEYQLGSVAPVVSVFYRYALAAMLLLVWCKVKGIGLSFGWRAHAHFLLLGLLLFSLNYVLTYRAQEHISSALTAIVFSTMLWMNLLNSRIFFGVRSGVMVWVGSFFGIAGILVLFLPEMNSLSLQDSTALGAALCLLAAFSASLGNMVSQSAQRAKLSVIPANAWGMLYGAALTGCIAAAQGQSFAIDWSLSYVGSLAFLVIFGSVIAFGAYLTLLGRIGAHKAGYALVMFPVVALVISFFVEDLEPSWNIFVGISLVLAGNVFVLRDREPQSERGEIGPPPENRHGSNSGHSVVLPSRS